MKKRVLSLILCGIMLLSSLPVAPVADLFSIQASAADISELQKVYESVPPRETWGEYIDTELLEARCDLAALALENPGSYTQSKIDDITANLKKAIEGLKFHTKGITLSSSTVSLDVGKTAVLTAKLNPEGAGDAVTWTSSNNSYVSVEKTSELEAVITAKKYTKSPISITATSNGKKAVCTVTVLNPLDSVKISSAKETLYENQSVTLSAEAVGVDSSAAPTGDIFYTWSSSKTAVATVSDDGVVTAVGAGSCTISVAATDENKKTVTAKCSLTVNKTIHITSIVPITSLTGGEMYLVAGETETFKLSLAPSDASFLAIDWTSSKPAVATVSDAKVSGTTASVKITAVAAGRTRITYTAADGSGKTGSFVVDVKPLVTSVEFTESVKVITLTTTGAKFTPKVTPSDAGNQVLTWKSSNESVCTVDKDGILYPKANGVCTITATTTDGSEIAAKGTLRVAGKTSTISLDKTTANLEGGKTVTLKATVTTSDGEKYTDVKWTSGDEKLATVDSKGVVTALYPGKVVITATALDGSLKTATCVVTITQPVTNITLPEEETVGIGASVKLVPTITPEYATDSTVKWTSSNPDVAEVDSKGNVTGLKQGVATITCTSSANSKIFARCTVSVVIATKGISLNKDKVRIPSGYKYELKATVTPEDATNKKVIWTSSNEKVATVSSSGFVTAVAGGVCTITATTESGGFTATCEVTVSQDATGVRLDQATKSMYVGQVDSLTATVLPETATNRTVVWSSGNNKVVTVNAEGKLTAVSKGTAIVTVKTESGGFTASCAVTVSDKVKVTGLTLDYTNLKIIKGESVAILATVAPENASEKTVKWTTSDKTVVTVSDTGVIQAVATGDAVIKAVTVDGNFEKQVKISVIQPVTGVSLNSDSVKLAKGKTKTLKATVSPIDATDKAVTWSSSDEKVAVVNSSGVITAKGPGIASIIATTKDGGYTASCNVNVYISVTGIELSAETVTLPKGEKRILTYNLVPADADNAEVVWTSSNEKIVTVNEVGQLTGRTKGTAKITVKTVEGGYSDSCVVEVVQLATGVSIDFTNVSINAGKTKTLTATVTPSTASDRTVTWKSSNTKVAKVSSKGVVTGVAAGTATITATSKDGAASDYCKVTVNQPATGVSLSKTSKVAVGKSVTLKATVKPDNATNKGVTWSSANTKIATVSSKGVVKGVKAGKVKITATTMDGQFKAACTVTVYTAVKSVKLNKTSLTLKYGSSTTITPTISPSGATDKSVKWTSSNYDVATVNENGKVTAKDAGFAVITATTTDGKKTATCNVNVVKPVTSVKLDKTSVTIEVGDKVTLKPTIKPSDASNKTVSYKSSSKSVATVSSSGKITAKKLGTATITVTTADGGKTAKCTVNVVKKVTGVKLNKTSATLYLDKTLTLKATVSPSDATTKTVKWTSSDTAIAKVSSKGVVTPVKPGNVTITVKTTDGSFTAKCSVAVKRKVTSISLNKTTLELNSDKTYTLKATLKPSNATDKTVTWKSSNTKIAKVSSKGVITPVGKGTATITATSESGLKATCKVTIYQVVTGVKLNKSTASVYTGSTLTLKATVSPSDANNPKVTWSSSNKAVATVSSKGVVTPVKAGTATITVKTKEGSLTAKCVVTVKQHVTSVSLDKTKLEMDKANITKLTATVKPSDATDKSVTFTSSDEKIVTVDDKGNLKAVEAGKATITVKTVDGGKTAKCTVTVVIPTEKIELDKTDITLYKGENTQLAATVYPEDASDKAVLWSSSNPGVATVNKDGVVTGAGKGEAIITATSADDNAVNQTCKVTVLLDAEEIKTDAEEYAVYENETVKIEAQVLPEGSENPTVSWKSSDESIATVDENGNVKGLKKGETTIVITSNQNEKVTKTVKIQVKKAVAAVKLDVTEKTVFNGDSFTLTATVLPEEASDKAVTWSSSDKAVATVKDGKVTAIKAGEAVITVTSKDGGKTASCKVTVKQLPEKIELSEESKTLGVGGKFTLTATVHPENTADKSVTFTSSDEKVAIVDKDGNVTAKTMGEAVITATASDGKTIAKCSVRVIKLAEKVEINHKEMILEKGQGNTLIATVFPEDATEKEITWVSSDEKVVSVDKDGKIKALKGGVAVIKAMTTTQGVFAECTVTVNVKSTAVALDKEKATLYVGETLTLKATITPEDTLDKSVIWSSSDESIATVDESGVVTAKAKGQAVITAKTKDSSLVASCTVTVKKHVTGVSFEKDEVTVYMGTPVTLNAVVAPTDADDKDLTWTSSDKLVATVKNGKVTPVKPGTSVITVTTKDGGHIAMCIVTVKEAEEKK